MKKATWSIEILPQNVSDVVYIPDLIKEIYITMIPGTSFKDTISAAQKIQALGKQAIPHLTARSFPDVEDLRTYLAGLQTSGIQRILLIGGGVPKPAGVFTSVMDMLKTEVFA